jgi:hypothetical protein
MSNIDLDIQNYKQEDIEKFFKLNIPYTVSDVEKNEYKIRTTLLSSDLVTKELKRDVIVFCTAAKQWLLFSKFGESSIEPISANGRKNPNPNLYDDYRQPPSSIPKNFRLDYNQLPVALTETIAKKEREVIYQEPKNFTYTDSSEFFKGDLNPLNTRVVNKCLAIDSKFRINYSDTQASDFMVQLPSKINKVVSMQLSSIEIPMTFYNISENYGNNYINISVDIEVNSVITQYNTVLIVPTCSYTANHLIYTLNKCLTSCYLIDSLGNLVNDSNNIFQNIVFELDLDSSGNGTGKTIIKLSNENSNIINIGLDFTKNIRGEEDNINIRTKMGWNIGFTYKKYTGDVSYISNTVIDMKTVKHLYLSIDDYQKSVNNLFLNAFDNLTVNENTLARISSDKEDFKIFMDNSLGLISAPRKYFGPVDLQRLHIQLFDEHGRILDFNESNFSFVLTLKVLYDV